MSDTQPDIRDRSRDGAARPTASRSPFPDVGAPARQVASELIVAVPAPSSSVALDEEVNDVSKTPNAP